MADNNPQDNAQPGQVIAPGGQTQPNEPSAANNPQQPPPVTSAQEMPQAAMTQQFGSEQFLSPDLQSDPENDAALAPAESISWTASEFVAHEKSPSWFLGLGAATIVIAAFVYLITKDKISTAVVVVCALALGVLANRKPRQLNYALSSSGITIGNRHFDYGSFKSFSVAPEGAFSSVIFMPLKRFAPTTTIYYAPEDEDKIVDLLSRQLPMEEHKPDAIDSVTKRIRF